MVEWQWSLGYQQNAGEGAANVLLNEFLNACGDVMSVLCVMSENKAVLVLHLKRLWLMWQARSQGLIQGNQYLLVVIEYFTKWAKVYSVADQGAPIAAD